MTTMVVKAVNALIVIDGGPGTAQAIERAGDLLGGKDGVATLFYLIPRAHLHGLGLPVADEWDDLAAERARAQGQLDSARYAASRQADVGVRQAIQATTREGRMRHGGSRCDGHDRRSGRCWPAWSGGC